jgi:hypothetical protein
MGIRKDDLFGVSDLYEEVHTHMTFPSLAFCGQRVQPATMSVKAEVASLPSLVIQSGSPDW